ncbi:MAG: LiaF domain-containing protein [Gemmatimonadales bacterium]|jgi:hypothetical protein
MKRTVAVLAVALAWVVTSASAQTLRTLTSARQLHGESSLIVEVTYAAGELRLGPASSGDLYRMELRYDEDKFAPVREYDPDAGVLRLGLRSLHGHTSLGSGHGEETPSLDVALTPDVPLTLRVDVGAAQTDVEFGGLQLRRLAYKTGASESHVHFSRPNPVECDALTFEAGAAEFTATGLGNSNCRRMGFHGGLGDVTLDFGGEWRTSADVNVKIGIGELKLMLPRDLGVAITLNRFLTSFDHDGFTKRGGVYYSDNYASAPYRLNLNIDAAFGGIEVRWLDGR